MTWSDAARKAAADARRRNAAYKKAKKAAAQPGYGAGKNIIKATPGIQRGGRPKRWGQ